MEALADARADATAMARVEAKAAGLPGTPRHMVATLDEPPSAEVMREFDRIFLLSPEIEEQAALETVFIDALGLPVTYLAAATYMENLLDEAEDIRRTGEIRAAAGGGRAGFAAVFAWQVEYADLPPERARELLLANGLTPWEADGAVERFDWIQQGGSDTVTGTVRELTGADPQPLHEWLTESRATFAGPS
jgi:NAD(P)H dehydrogenase (quinone)